MDKQEKHGDNEREEQALRLFELLHNVPEDLLERSDKRNPNFIMFVQRYRTTLVACLVLFLLGAGFLGYRSAVGGSSGTSNEAAMDEGFSVTMESADMNEAAPEEGYVAENDVVADLFQEIMGGAGQSETTASKEMADGLEGVTDVVTEHTQVQDKQEDVLAGKLSTIVVPEGYQYESITSARKSGGEVLDIRLKNEDGNYLQVIISSGVAVSIPEAYKEVGMYVVDLKGQEVDLSVEGATLPVDEKGISYLNIYFSGDISVNYSGTMDAKTLYQFLQSIK